MDESTSLPLLRSLAEFPKSLIGQKQHKALSKGLGEKGFTFERTEKEEQSLELKSLSMGAWKEDMGLVEVTDHRGSHWKTHGHTHLGKLLLQPEEALFLMECGSLEVCTHGGVPMSIQQAYHTMLSNMDLVQYQVMKMIPVYASLKRLGYTVFRVQLLGLEMQRQVCSDLQDVGQGMVPRGAQGGEEEEEGRENGRDRQGGEGGGDRGGGGGEGGQREEGKGGGERQGGEGGGREEGRGERRGEGGGREKGEGDRDREGEVGGRNKRKATHSGMPTSEKRMKLEVETVSCCPLCTSVHSLARSTPTPASRLQMLEVYQPRNHFKKTDPGPPQFRVIVSSPMDPFPSPTLVQLLSELNPRAPVKFCVVDGASTAYYSLTHATIAPPQS